MVVAVVFLVFVCSLLVVLVVLLFFSVMFLSTDVTGERGEGDVRRVSVERVQVAGHKH